MDRLDNLEHEVHQKKEEGAQGISEYMKSLQAQSELLQEQRNLEGLKADADKKINEVSARRKQMQEQTDRIAADTVHKFDGARDAASELMHGAKANVGTHPTHESRNLLDKISDAFTPNKSNN